MFLIPNLIAIILPFVLIFGLTITFLKLYRDREIISIYSLGLNLTCLKKAFGLIKSYYGLEYNLSTIPPEDKSTYTMLGKGDSLGIFQVESRAQMNFLPMK